MKAIKFLAGLFLLLSLSVTASAQNGRSAVQHKRIKAGAKSGELTHHERKQLARQQRHIRAEKREARADGVVTGKEHREIRREERRASRNIYRKKHNNRVKN